MDVFEITGFKTGVSREGVNFLQPSDSFQNIRNGYIHRQVLQSRRGFSRFSTGALSDGTRVMGIFQHTLNNNTFETLAVSKNFLYKYNEGTNTFDQIPFAGSVAAGFTISSNEDYVSGTSYSDKDGNDRFVFCSNGLNNIYFYDGTDVKSFTDAGDNPDFEQPAQGNLTRAWFVNLFGERLNFYSPTISNRAYPQGVLYSGSRDSSGKGDKFNSVGSGLLQADTFEYISGVSIINDVVVINFSKSNWILQKTPDAFNPYFIKKIAASNNGTSAPFSAIAWNRS